MAYERNPDDPNRFPNDPYRASRIDNDLQVDPELAEGPASGSKIAMFAVAAALVLGAVFYGLNNSSSNHASTSGTSSTAQNGAQTSPPAAPPGMRDVTPRANTEPGMTTGAAPSTPARPAPPPAAANPPTDNNAPAK